MDAGHQGTPVRSDAGDVALRERLAADVAAWAHALRAGQWPSCLSAGAGLERVPEWRAAAQRGWPVGLWLLGCSCYVGVGAAPNRAEGLRLLRLAAEGGYAEAQYWAGTPYARGQGVEQDHTEALRWYRLAAEQGHPDGQYETGNAYTGAHGVAEDYAEAARWYRLAAEQGHAQAQWMLGVLHEAGLGVPQDRAEAARYYRAAAGSCKEEDGRRRYLDLAEAVDPGEPGSLEQNLGTEA